MKLIASLVSVREKRGAYKKKVKSDVKIGGHHISSKPVSHMPCHSRTFFSLRIITRYKSRLPPVLRYRRYLELKAHLPAVYLSPRGIDDLQSS